MGKNRGKLNRAYIEVIKGNITALVVTILAVLIYAVILKSFSMTDSSIPYFNQAIKIIGIMIAGYYSVKNGSKMYLGLIGGVCYIIVTYLLFSAIIGEFGGVASLGSDLIMGGVIGAIFGLITSKMKLDRKAQGKKA